MLSPRFAAWIYSVVFTALAAGVASGQGYPNKPIRLVTSETGGSTDSTSRLVAQGISGPLGQPVIVENRGGGGNISGEIVTRAAPDGYTVLVTGSSFWIAPLLRKAAYDPVRGFTPVSFMVNSPNVLVVHPAGPIKTVRDLIDLAKAKPGELNYASASTGSSVHLAAELFKSMASVNIVHIPYKGAGAAFTSVISGQVQMMFAVATSATPHVRSGKLRAVAVTSAQPSALFPGLATVAATLPGYETGGATAMFAPARTPATIINRLNREIVAVLTQPDVKEKFFNVGAEIVASSPEQLAARVKSEMARLGKVVKDAGIRLD